MTASMSMSLLCPLCGCSISRGQSFHRALCGSKAYSFCPHCGADHDPKARGWKAKVNKYLLKKGVTGVFNTVDLGMTILYSLIHRISPDQYQHLKALLEGTNLSFLIEDPVVACGGSISKESFEEMMAKVQALG